MTRNRVGRPTLYRTEYCEQIIEAMKTGLSASGFAGQIGVSRRAISQWAEVNPVFMHALACAKAACALHWERLALRAGENAREGGNVAIIIFALRNLAPADWAEKATVALTGDGSGPIRIEESREALVQSVLDILAAHAAAGTA